MRHNYPTAVMDLVANKIISADAALDDKLLK